MSQQRKNFIPRNEGFLCAQCGASVPAAPHTFRNHCPECLTSQHVDVVPGDRAASCKGLMEAVRVEGTDPARLVIVHRCQRCGVEQRNRTATDDNFRALLALLSPKPR